MNLNVEDKKGENDQKDSIQNRIDGLRGCLHPPHNTEHRDTGIVESSEVIIVSEPPL